MCAACNCRKAMQNSVNDLSPSLLSSSKINKSLEEEEEEDQHGIPPSGRLPFPYMQRAVTNVTLKPRRLEWQFPFSVTPPSDIGGGLSGEGADPGWPGHTRTLFSGLKTPRHIFPGRLSQTFRSSSSATASSSFPSRRRRRGIFIRLRRLSEVSAI